MGELGVGKKIAGKRAGFSLKTVCVDDNPLYSSDDHKIRQYQAPEDLTLEALSPSADTAVHGLEITLKTPLRLKFQNKLEATLPFHVFTRAMLRRISSLSNYYGNGEPPLDYRGLVERAKSVQIKESSLTWFDWKRYSNKQDQSMLMGGIVGRIRYAGDLTEFVPLIRCCEEVHLGKQTSFGLGKIELTKVWQ